MLILITFISLFNNLIYKSWTDKGVHLIGDVTSEKTEFLRNELIKRYGMQTNFLEYGPSLLAEVMSWILGGRIKGLSEDDMLNFWCITGKTVCFIYYDTVKRRQRAASDRTSVDGSMS